MYNKNLAHWYVQSRCCLMSCHSRSTWLLHVRKALTFSNSGILSVISSQETLIWLLCKLVLIIIIYHESSGFDVVYKFIVFLSFEFVYRAHIVFCTLIICRVTHQSIIFISALPGHRFKEQKTTKKLQIFNYCGCRLQFQMLFGYHWLTYINTLANM